MIMWWQVDGQLKQQLTRTPPSETSREEGTHPSLQPSGLPSGAGSTLAHSVTLFLSTLLVFKVKCGRVGWVDDATPIAIPRRSIEKVQRGDNGSQWRQRGAPTSKVPRLSLSRSGLTRAYGRHACASVAFSFASFFFFSPLDIL